MINSAELYYSVHFFMMIISFLANVSIININIILLNSINLSPMLSGYWLVDHSLVYILNKVLSYMSSCYSWWHFLDCLIIQFCSWPTFGQCMSISTPTSFLSTPKKKHKEEQLFIRAAGHSTQGIKDKAVEHRMFC